MPGVDAPPDTSDPPGSTDVDTQLTHTPAAVTASAAVEFSFTSATAGVGFVCRLDNAAFAACNSPVQLTVAEGHHTFAVAAVLGAVQDPTPASFAFTVDLTPPDTSIVSGPTGTVTASEAMFMFAANEPNASFECRLDSAAFAACQSTQSYSGLALGQHSVAVRAIDAAGNPDPSPASATWTVGQVTPQTTIDSTPDPLTRSTTATFAFSSTTAGAMFRCAIDGGAAVACISPQTFTSLVNGDHHFTVQAIASGVADPTPASFDWTIDLVPPVVTIDAGPESQSITGGNVSFAFSSPENVPGEAPVVTFECHLDGAAVGLCQSPNDYVGLADGNHLFEVRGVDRAQNRSGFIGRFWSVNNSKPSVMITSPVNGSITKGEGMIAFSGTEPGMMFACSLDGAPAAPCTSPVPYAFATDEQHHVVVTGTGHGMTSEPVSVTWEADGVVPVVTIAFPPDDGVTIPGPFVTIEFSSDPGVTFMCSFNGFSFNPCASGDLVGFVDGPNDLRVQATDRAGNVSAVARRTFIVDSVGPKVTLKVTPVRASTVTRASGVVTYTSPTATTFDCRAYPTGTTPPDLAPCPVTGFELAPFGFTDGAAVTVDVRGRDQHGILGKIATLNLSIDERPPSITITSPAAMVGRDSVMLFNNPEAAHVICSVETAAGAVVIGPFLDCSGLSIHLTVSGDYNGVIAASDSLGNSATYKRPFHVDASLPIAPSDAPRSR